MNPTESKILALLASRKFWTLLAALVADAGAYATHQIDATAAITALIAAIAAYQLATGIEDHGTRVAQGQIAAASFAQPTTPVVPIVVGPPPQG